jgi:hypothetical protein
VDRNLRHFGRMRIRFSPKVCNLNFKEIQLKVLYFSLTFQIHCGTLIIALVRMSVTCYIRFMFVRNEFISLLEIISFQRMRMNIFTVQKY